MLVFLNYRHLQTYSKLAIAELWTRVTYRVSTMTDALPLGSLE